MFQIVAVNLEACRALPPREFKTLVTLLSWCDRSGRCWPSLRQIADACSVSESTACRSMRCLSDRGVFAERTRAGNGRYRYVLAEAYRPRWPSSQAKQALASAGLQDGLAQSARPKEVEPKKYERAAAAPRFAGFKGQEGLPRQTDWEPRLRGWLKTRFWLPAWGPKPNESNHLIPASVMAAVQGLSAS